MDRPLKPKKDAGFSLIEAALALAIMGVVAGLAIPALLNMLHIGKIKTTHAHQEAVMTALAAYALREGYLPYPVDPATPGLACEELSNSRGAIGGIPYITLGIPEKYAKDGFNRPMVYAIPKYIKDEATIKNNAQRHSLVGSQIANKFSDKNMTLPKDIFFCFQGSSNNYIEIKNAANQSLVFSSSSSLLERNYKDEFIAAVILSYGDDYSTDGEGEGERLNRNTNLEFMDRPYSTQPKDKHRHILKWVTRDFLMAHYGHTSCPAIRAEIARQNLQMK